jgi:hypothetical protein
MHDTCLDSCGNRKNVTNTFLFRDVFMRIFIAQCTRFTGEFTPSYAPSRSREKLLLPLLPVRLSVRLSICPHLSARLQRRVRLSNFIKICWENQNIFKIGEHLDTLHDDLSTFYCCQRY